MKNRRATLKKVQHFVLKDLPKMQNNGSKNIKKTFSLIVSSPSQSI